jgi:hypothetical protein
VRRLKQLEDENGKLKKIVADLSLDRIPAGAAAFSIFDSEMMLRS